MLKLAMLVLLLAVFLFAGFFAGAQHTRLIQELCVSNQPFIVNGKTFVCTAQ